MAIARTPMLRLAEYPNLGYCGTGAARIGAAAEEVQMLGDWSGPRLPDKPISPIVIALEGLLVAFGYISIIWRVIEMVRGALG